MPRIARRVADAPTSATVLIADIATDMRRRGIDVIDFSAGRAAEHTPQYIRQEAIRALESGDTHQTPAQGTRRFREACAAKLARDNGIIADPDTEIIATMGCKQGLTLALLSAADVGAEIIVEDPGFVSYAPTVQFCGAVPVPVPLRSENGFRWSARGPRGRRDAAHARDRPLLPAQSDGYRSHRSGPRGRGGCRAAS